MGNLVTRIADKAGNKVALLSKLSSDQALQVQFLRENYLANLDAQNPDDDMAREYTEHLLAASSIEIYNAFLPQLKDLYLPLEKDIEYEKEFDSNRNIRYINITKWVTDKEENSLEKLVNVYAVLSDEECNIALIFNRTQNKTNVYLAVVNLQNSENNRKVNSYKKRIVDAIKGNFPGAEWIDDGDNNYGEGIPDCLADSEKLYSVATASNIPAEKSEKFVSQTIEKLLDGIIPTNKKEEYTLILLATPILDVQQRKLRLGEFYSGMAPYESWQTDFHIMDTESLGSSATVGVNVGASAGVQNGQNYSVTDSQSETEQSSQTVTDIENEMTTKGNSTANSLSEADTKGTNSSTANTKTETKGESKMHQDSSSEATQKSDSSTLGASVSGTVGVTETVGVEAGGSVAKVSGSVAVNASVTAGVNTSHTLAEAYTKTKSIADAITKTSSTAKAVTETIGSLAQKTLTEGITNTISNSVSKSTGKSVANTLGKAVTKGLATTSGIAKSTSLGANFGANFARSSTVTATIGKNEGLTRTFKNYNIKHALELLEMQMKRLEQSTALGMWDFAAYVLSEDPDIVNNVAHSYVALTQGEDSYASSSAINVWRGNIAKHEEDLVPDVESDIARNIISYVRELRHPVFVLNPYLVVDVDKEFNEYPTVVTPTTSLSGKELAYSLNFPRKSVAGLPVLECTAFARNVVSYGTEKEVGNDKINLGKVFHMNHVENGTVDLSMKSLTSHTFITGSTGSGKSNTIYQIINLIRKKNAGQHFLVIEPAKGEYKNVFGNDKDVSVYGTNPSLTPLLRMNPFSFPKNIHILEHLDRLVEIFNVCWPMYAAMPAVLKGAIEKAYEEAGWDLLRSENRYDSSMYPDFRDVARNVKAIIDSSEYDTENKGAYKGSLLTRLSSLTTGINGLIFSTNEIPEVDLFDQNVIVDLSRVGSVETKALLMGILVLKLQEYRISSEIPMNSDLRHITILEEAHNLLRRTSIEQHSEGANLLGKSVEMLSNAIAEMRTYGEGFIIADQAPGLMDMSVIRNTNTKIIMRLPDQSDRMLVGKAANLSDDQIKELAKLPCGVAAVYQNEWIEPVLSKVDRYEYPEEQRFQNTSGELNSCNESIDASERLLEYIMDQEIARRGEIDKLEELKEIIIRSRLGTNVKVDFLRYLEDEDNAVEFLRCLIYDFFNAKEAIEDSKHCSDIREWVNSIVDQLQPSIKGYSKEQVDLLIALIIYEQATRDTSYEELFCRYTEEYQKGGGIF